MYKFQFLKAHVEVPIAKAVPRFYAYPEQPTNGLTITNPDHLPMFGDLQR